jgi:hypothetical protein
MKTRSLRSECICGPNDLNLAATTPTLAQAPVCPRGLPAGRRVAVYEPPFLPATLPRVEFTLTHSHHKGLFFLPATTYAFSVPPILAPLPEIPRPPALWRPRSPGRLIADPRLEFGLTARKINQFHFSNRLKTAPFEKLGRGGCVFLQLRIALICVTQMRTATEKNRREIPRLRSLRALGQAG